MCVYIFIYRYLGRYMYQCLNLGDANHMLNRMGSKTGLTEITCLAGMRSKSGVTRITCLAGMRSKIGVTQITCLAGTRSKTWVPKPW